MSPVSLIPILPILLIALGTMNLINSLVRINPPTGRYRSIDGLRGYLAFFVFLHHAVIWYFFLKVHQWSFPPSQLYSHLGPTSVALFFMITSFLFFSKLIESKGGHIDWFKLYVSRFLRILPLYFFAVLVLFILVGFLSDWKLNEPIINVGLESLQWFTFIEANINGISGTNLIVAGVVWSLAFEWMFYFSLPFWGLLLFRIMASVNIMLFAGILLLVFIGIIYEFYPYAALRRMSPFLGGMVAALLARNSKVQRIASEKYVSFLIILLLLITILFFPSVYSPIPYICVCLVFIAIACGNTLFGILSHHTSRLLGQISYSLYMLHGILLFITFKFVLGFEYAAAQSPMEYWIIIAFCSIILIIICSFTYYYIERPCINAGAAITERMKNYFKDA